MAGYSAVKPTLAKLAKFRQIRHRQCCGKTLSKLPNLPLRAFLDISGIIVRKIPGNMSKYRK